jgi:uncharacterized membrane protein YeaQ/YmgE (transglycosylase-associated protein family)
MDTTNVIAWLVIGALVGLIAAVITRRQTTTGYITDIVVGLVGGFVGGLILSVLNITAEGALAGVNILGAVIAVVGAIVLLVILEYVRGTSQ